MLQGGHPTASGRGGPGYEFANELHPGLRHKAPGTFSMTNAGPGTNGMNVMMKITGRNNTGERGCKCNGVGDKITSIDVHDDTTALRFPQR